MNDQDILNRLKVCAECQFRVEDECGLCGCEIETITANPESSCPDNPSRWGKFVEKKEAAPVMQEAAPVKQPKKSCAKCQARTK